MDTIKLPTSDYIREESPHLFEYGDESTQIEVDWLSDGKVELYLQFPEYVASVIRAHTAERAREAGSAYLARRAAQKHQWRGEGLELTPKQARKLAKSLKLQAKLAEQAASRD